jgi:hypothetical protein
MEILLKMYKIFGNTKGIKKIVPIVKAYVVIVNESYIFNNLFPMIEYIDQQIAESIIKILPIKYVTLNSIFSFEICTINTSITPKKESKTPIDFLIEKFSLMKIAESIAIKMTFVLIKTAEVEAEVYDIPIN